MKSIPLRVGTLVYYDSFAGLIPGKVVGFCYSPHRLSMEKMIMVKLTIRKRRGGYKPGEVIFIPVRSAPHSLVPRDAISTRGGKTYIRGGWEWKVEMPRKLNWCPV